ncbi:maleylpyruvate isomerase family mycothiol-dependent enzyme [Mycolicibacterium brumae]|uniref:Maleylpyruvate isomerase family mycothiol-dependent enzyme n=1 Tax=Mycolicibacterium brumae TaxID=85968 RepID=A0A2G5PFJ9_9MYCO|nr:maleylpyruvate isomerase family mycothiol-dependent enzyme [Mycolicibacterium brumae]MCV7194231.1 maleylpyruvate isomerase family mycothiol-dependent enzyme [Mycolicibacterium brumae]PIB77085.1 maleylpyruvate isomerase family mycothiol-dependent enzyme [Mycolicibacterium brumae]RWA19292.1 hypothetical protein MBRU_17190 [Mycolicibacterium brumae DSM 44177]UWW10418.1 maleylpyruvate isomerase family mycothiol-dependent enzyme [Mycolicibacterium brumae]
MDFVAEFLAQNRAFGDTVAVIDEAASVPTCPGWTVKQLFRHVGRGNLWAAQMVAERATAPADPAKVPGGRPPGDPEGDRAWLDAGARLLVDAVNEVLTEDGPEAMVWTFWGPRPAPWWIRRRLHELLVHRADAAAAGGFDFEARPELAADCIDEWLDSAVRMVPDLPFRVHLHATDYPGEMGEWMIGGGTWTHTHGTAELGLRGPVRDLLLVVTGRRPVAETDIEVFGDESLLPTWRAGMKF